MLTSRPLPILAGLLGLGAALGLPGAPVRGAAQSRTITVEVRRPGAPISPTLFGLFFEDINFGADGGLYPERIKNRSFEFPDPLMGWQAAARGGAKGALQVMDAGGRHFLQLRTEVAGEGYGVANEGFRGIGLSQGEEYRFSVRARAVGSEPASLRVLLEGPGGQPLGQARVTGIGRQWKTLSVPLPATGTEPKARLVLLSEGAGAVDVDDVSLFPRETWGGRKNGLRPDLVQLLKDMKPGFLRFPGGCIVEGRRLDTRYQWKTTVGPREDRRLIVNRWNTEFRHRPAPDYYQSFGLGFFEYFQLCEDIGAEPLPILNCGMACQFNSGELAPLDALDPYVQDALDLIEFANGPVTSPWGKQRAALGHPAPFRMKLLGVGNEQWGPQYLERYEVFQRVLKRKHPEIQLISSAGPSPDGERFDLLWKRLRELKADLVDEHYYMAPKWFRDNAGRYDAYPRTGPKVFAGEYAAQSVGIASPNNRNNWECALSEAAFMTGLERNADVVRMSSYAPLFGHVEGWQWTPNLIWFDNLRSYGTPNYYVQKLFSTNRGTRILPVTVDGAARSGEQELFTSAARDDRAGEVVVKIVNTSGDPRPVRIALADSTSQGEAWLQVLSSPDLKAENSLDAPRRVSPVARTAPIESGQVPLTLDPYSVTVLRVKAAQR